MGITRRGRQIFILDHLSVVGVSRLASTNNKSSSSITTHAVGRHETGRPTADDIHPVFVGDPETGTPTKDRVHAMANKKIKCNLHMASVVAVKHDAGLKAYYERKVREGKKQNECIEYS